MKKFKKTILFQLAALLCIVLASCDDDENYPALPVIVKPDVEFFGLTADNMLVKYNANGESAMQSMNISGILPGEKLAAIDFRPATGQLYAVSTGSRLYVINQVSGVATPIGTGPFTPAISGSIAFDFNPTVDRIRIVTSSGQNLRLNPETGAVAAMDGTIDPGSAAISAVAYTNSMAGATMTTLFDIDVAGKKLYRQDPPNDGKLVEVGNLSINTMAEEACFDIAGDNNVALASVTDGTTSTLYQIDLSNGSTAELGQFSKNIIALAIPTNPVAYAVDASNNLQIFNLATPANPVSKPIAGLASGETILGIDMRPATGQLYALGSTSRLYTINMANGMAAPVGTEAFSTLLDGTSFGFDFNPAVDRVRIVSNTGQNLRVHPVTGLIASVDGPLSPGTPAVSSVAYTNNIPNAMTTTLLDIDVNADKLFTQTPPNDGILVEIGNLGIDIDATNGFDIGGTSGMAYGLFTVGGTTKIYSINTMTGAASAISDFPIAANAFTVGLGF